MTASKPPESDAHKVYADWLRLSLIPQLGPVGQRRLLAAFGLPEQIFQASYQQLSEQVGETQARLLADFDDEQAIAAGLIWANTPGNHLISIADENYPKSFFELADPPVLLYAKGDPKLLSNSALAIVGARAATAQGTQNAFDFAAALTRAGLIIVSGQASGIDKAAHEGCLKTGGKTVAVIGTGIDRVYPASNRELARQIAEHGLIISEFPLTAPARPYHFPRRNRLIAALGSGVLVVEAGLGSGSLITAKLANEMGKEVFAIPGSIHSPLSRGCHQLIREGAKLVETTEDVMVELGWQAQLAPVSHHASGKQHELALANWSAPDRAQAELILQAMDHESVTLDTLVARTDLTAASASAMLIRMELEGCVAQMPGGRFQRLIKGG